MSRESLSLSFNPAGIELDRRQGLSRQLYQALRAGRHDEARSLSDVFAPLRAAWAWGSFPVVIKEAMDLVGRSAGPTRPPIAPLSPKVRGELSAVVQRIAHASF